MSNKPDEIIFTTEDGEDAQALILKDISELSDEEAVYDIVEDDHELELVAGIFKELLEDIELS